MLIPFFDVAGFSVAQLAMQVVGALLIGTWTVLATMVTLTVADALFGLRVSKEEESTGLDRGEHGIAAYPEFGESGGTAVADGGRRVETDGGQAGD
jgi:Amt family ammonium transporter